jgi:2-polyprenyl-3-methyl-5-hydroxy-6-metoxy-1,4-benzoquinol methylase
MTEKSFRIRSTAFAQSSQPTTLDRLGRSLSQRRIRSYMGSVAAKVVADVGCGYDAGLARQLFVSAAEIVLVDIEIDPSLATWQPGVRLIRGYLPEVMSEISSDYLDVVLANNIVEHLWEPGVMLAEMRRVTKPGGLCIINVPSWRGKRYLETAAFRLSMTSSVEIDDHKYYFDPRDLWSLLVRASFRPSDISCRRHKFGLNTIARARKT